jgi:aldose 1-epimerase
MFLIEKKQEDNTVVIVLQNSRTKAFAEIFSFGALLNGYGFLQEKIINCIDGYANAKAAFAEKETWFKSCFLSPFVCRLNAGKFLINNKLFTIDKFYMGKHAIHGLVYDLDYKICKQQVAETFCCVSLQAQYMPNDNGFPFNYEIEHEYRLDENGLTVTSLITNKSNMAMPYAQGWHPYFRLNETVEDCSLQVSSNKQVEFDMELIPTKKLIYNSTYLNPTVIKNTMLDDCFILENDKKAILKNSKYSFVVKAIKGYNYMQIFTPDHRKNIAIEVLSGVPDCFNNGMGLLQINPGETKEFTVNYRLELL